MPSNFLNNIAKPWNDLKDLLAKPYCLEPKQSDVTRAAEDIAIRIKHQVDLLPSSKTTASWQKEIDEASLEARLMSDLGDTAKHNVLRNPDRLATVEARSVFEWAPPSQFRFLGNKIKIRHASLGEHDFMAASLSAMRFWAMRRNLPVKYPDELAPTAAPWRAGMFLALDNRYCISVKSCMLEVVQRDNTGALTPIDPKGDVLFAVYNANSTDGIALLSHQQMPNATEAPSHPA